MRGSPVSVNTPVDTAKAAHNGRIAVPALPKYSSTEFSPSLKTPPIPVTSTELTLTLSFTFKVCKASIIREVSSDFKTFNNLVLPLAKAEINRALLVRLLDPGKITLPSTDFIFFKLRAFFNYFISFKILSRTLNSLSFSEGLPIDILRISCNL